VQLFFKIAIAHLLEDVGVPRFVDLEGFAAVGADDFVHTYVSYSCVQMVECQYIDSIHYGAKFVGFKRNFLRRY
jgi:hypothetical protein